MASLPLPLRVALAAVLLLAAVWMVAFRPAAVQPEPPLPVQPAGGAAPAAAPVAAQSGNGGTVAPDAPASAQPVETAPPKAAAPAEPVPVPRPARGQRPVIDPSGRLLAAVDEGRAVVLLFSDGRAPEDRAAQRAVTGLRRRGGRVLVRRAPMADVGRYEAITRGVMVGASPTILVIGPSHTARPIVGLTTRANVEQAVADALDLSADPLAAARFERAQAVRGAVRECDGDKACVTHFAAANDACLSAAEKALSGAVAGPAAQMAAVRSARTGAAQLTVRFAAVAVPPAQRGAHARATKLLQGRVATFDRLLASSKDAAVVGRRVRRSPRLRRSDRQLRALGYGACG